jgi:hypothetical protein
LGSLCTLLFRRSDPVLHYFRKISARMPR